MWIVKSLMAVFVATFALAVTDAIAKDAVYRWVDDNGVVHFSDQRAASADAEKVDIKPSRTTKTQSASGSESASIYQKLPEPSRAQKQRDEFAARRKKDAEQKAKIDAACVQRRQIINRLEPRTMVLVKDDSGKVRRLDDGERLKVLGEAKSFIAENCSR